MNEITITQPHGVLLDGDGLVVVKFGRWETGQHQVPDSVQSVEYVDGPTAHKRDVADKYRTNIESGGL